MSREAAPAERAPLWSGDFAALMAAQLCFGYAFSSFFLLPTFLSRELGASASQVGWIMSAGAAASALLLPVVGHATDRLGRRVFLVRGGVLMALSCVGFAFVDSVGLAILALRLLQAAAFAMAFAAGGALAVDLAPEGRTGQAVSWFGLTFLAMNGLASATVERIAALASWDAAFGLAGAVALLSAALASRMRAGGPRSSAVAESPSPHAPARTGFVPLPLRCLGVMACTGFALGAMFNFAQLYGARLGERDVGVFFVTYALAGVAVRTIFGHRFDAWGVHRVATTALVAYMLVVESAIRLDLFGLALVGGALGAAHGVFYPTSTAVALGLTSALARGRVMAYVQGAFALGVTASGALGAVADVAGYPAVFALASVALLSALMMLVGLTGDAGAGAALADAPPRERAARTS